MSRTKSKDDWIIDLDPKGGYEIVATGVPEDVVKELRSYMCQYMAPRPKAKREAVAAEQLLCY